MKKALFFVVVAICIISFIIVTALDGLAAMMTFFAPSEVASFESFYKTSSPIIWFVSIILAVVAGVAIYFTAGGATPFIASIGSMIGGWMGLSGIAATNAGLALLGGGAIINGGLGIAGGIAVLTAALSFSTGVITDITINTLLDHYSYSELVEQSKKYPTLPIPKNDNGPKAYQNAIKKLSSFNEKEPSTSENNTNIIQLAIAEIGKYEFEPTMFETQATALERKNSELARVESAKAILYFILSDYEKALESSQKALSNLTTRQMQTVPLFITASSEVLLSDKNSLDSIDSFSLSIFNEPKSGLPPLLFSLFLNRLALADKVNNVTLKRLVTTAMSIKDKDEDVYKTNLTIIIGAYFTHIKKAQMLITLLEKNTHNTSIDFKTHSKNAISEYRALTEDCLIVLNCLISVAKKSEEQREVAKYNEVLYQYKNDIERLQGIVDKLQNIAKAEPPVEPSKEPNPSIFDRVKSFLGIDKK